MLKNVVYIPSLTSITVEALPIYFLIGSLSVPVVGTSNCLNGLLIKNQNTHVLFKSFFKWLHGQVLRTSLFSSHPRRP